MQEELDENLRSLFREKSPDLPQDPFVGNALKLIKKQHSRQILMRRLIFVLGFACCIVLSPFLIKGSILLCSYLNAIFEAAGSFLDKPTGILAGGLCCALLFLIFRRRLMTAFT